MTVAFADIKDKFDRVFGFIRRDLERILTLDPGGNFAVATLLACACEALARYRNGSGDGADIFARLLPPGPFKTISNTLYDVLRNGFVHHYNTADIRVERSIIRLAIAWKEQEHLSIKVIDGVPNLVLNMTRICNDLFSAFEEYRTELERSGEARDLFFKIYNSVGIKDIKVPKEITAWQEILKSGQI